MHYWTFRCIDTMSRSRDQVQVQTFKPLIPLFCQQIARLGVTHMTYAGPYDDETTLGAAPGWRDAWVAAIRATGAHIWWRMVWANWQGMFGQPMLTFATTPAIPYATAGGAAAVLDGTDTTSYLARTYQFIVQHPTLFADGDVFAPVSEPSDAGVGPNPAGTPYQFPDLAAFQQFLPAMTTVCTAAFQAIGKQVTVGLYGSGWYDDGVWLPASVAQAVGPFSIDDYTQDPAQMQQNLATLHDAWGLPIWVGEWGADGETTEDARVHLVDRMMRAIAALPFVPGINYFEAWSYPPQPHDPSASNLGPAGDGLLDRDTLAILPHGHMLAAWYRRMTPPWQKPLPVAGAIAGGATGAVIAARLSRHGREQHRPAPVVAAILGAAAGAAVGGIAGAAGSGLPPAPVSGLPTITAAQQTGPWTWTFTGEALGNAPVPLPFTGTTAYTRVQDLTGGWEAGYSPDNNALTLTLTAWSPTSITCTVNWTSGYPAAAGDWLLFRFQNAATGQWAAWETQYSGTP